MGRWCVAALALVAGLLPTAGVAYAATPRTAPTSGVNAIGVLADSDPNQHGCSAGIVDSPRGNVIVTAAHCVYGKSALVFAPGYHDGQAPFGVWKVVSAFVWDGWKTNQDINGAGSPYDYAFLVVESHSGKSVQQTAGASLRLTPDTGLPEDISIFGYASAGNANYQNKPYRCDSSADLDGQFWITTQCLGIPGGFSGGPWVRRGTNDLVGVIGGRGQNLPDTDARNYSVRFDSRVRALYDRAVNAPIPPSTGNSGNLGYPLGDGALWKHADLIANGYFTGGSPFGSRHMDMIVKWSDGEVTLYQGSGSSDPAYPFVGETQLAAPGGLWTHAVTIAAGNFGAAGDGLIVRWSDGELTRYTTVDQGGFHDEVQLAAPNDTWTHAKLITVGEYNGYGRDDDLLVVWTDGEVSLYSNVTALGIGEEHQLAAPNATWTHAVALTSVHAAGYDLADLMVRWTDGELTMYGGVNTGGLGQEIQVQAPNSLWQHATVIAGGAFTANALPNDFVVRWSDGELTLYQGVNSAGLHSETQWVNPNGSAFQMNTPPTPAAPAPQTAWDTSTPPSDTADVLCADGGTASRMEYKVCLFPSGGTMRARGFVYSPGRHTHSVTVTLTSQLGGNKTVSCGEFINTGGYMSCNTGDVTRAMGPVKVTADFVLDGAAVPTLQLNDLQVIGKKQESDANYCGPASIQTALATMRYTPPSQAVLAGQAGTGGWGTLPWDMASTINRNMTSPPAGFTQYAWAGYDEQGVGLMKGMEHVQQRIAAGQPAVLLIKAGLRPWAPSSDGATRHYIVLYAAASNHTPGEPTEWSTTSFMAWDPAIDPATSSPFHKITVPQLVAASQMAGTPDQVTVISAQ
ncbi:hypothetical protein Lfu02_12490 [Longispora fulva]|nr:hypothetical protein Lfu02_12490 [Longispora fulva]